MSILGALFLLSLVVAMACGEGPSPDTPDFATRIENGVIIAENAGLHVADTLAWTIDTTDVVRFGVLDGPDEYVFGRISGVTVRSDGSIVVADDLASELRVFDPGGRFLSRIGGEGDGPGEFRGIQALHAMSGDTIAVVSGGRVHVLDAQYELVTTYTPRLSEMSAEPPFTSDKLETVFDDGSPLMSDFLSVCRTGTGALCVDSILFHRTDESGTISGRFGRFVWARRVSHRVEPGLSTAWSEPHPQAFWTVSGDRFYYADAQRFEILVFTSDGALSRRIRVNADSPRFPRSEVFPDRPPRPPSRDRRAVLAERVLRDAQREAELPDTFPAFSDLLVDERGNVWVREYLPPGLADTPSRWWIFDSEGRLRWSVRSPASLVRRWSPVRRVDPYIGSNVIVVRVQDDLDVDAVVVYRLNKR